MSNKPKIENFKKVLVVEGYSDLLFFAELHEHLRIHQEVFIKCFNGVTDLMTKLETFLSPGLLALKDSIAVVVDADDNAAGRIEAVSKTLERICGRPLQHGVWLDGNPKIGFFVVPDGQQPGEIETLVWNSWANDSDNQDQQDCIHAYLNCMSSLGFDADSPDKGKISALLAVKNDEDPRLGPGARRGVFNLDRPEFGPLLDFLKGL